MNDEQCNKNIIIKCEPKDYELSPSQNKNDIKLMIQNKILKNTCDEEEYMYANYNLIHHAIDIKEDNTKFGSENSYNQSLNTDQSNVNTIEFVNVKVEHIEDFDTEESSSDNILDPIAANDGFLNFNKCKEEFETVASCHKHTRRCEDRKYGQPSKSNANASVAAVLDKKPRLSTNQEGFYMCNQCDKKFKSRTGLYAHVRTHSGVGLHTCSECSKQFTAASNLAKHMLVHTLEKPHKCTQCEAAFNQTSSLKTHMLIHSGVRPHKCTQCGKSFTISGALIRHIRTHTGEKPYQCTQCSKYFGDASVLTSHMIIHTGEKPCQCIHCGKFFRKSSDLTRHKRTHTSEKPYQCTQCSKSFTQSGSLKTHMKTHTGEKPHQCAICHRAFSEKGNLKTHMKIHSREIGQDKS